MIASENLVASITTEPTPDPLKEWHEVIHAADTCVKALAALPPESRTKAWRYVTEWVNKSRPSADQSNTSNTPVLPLPNNSPSGVATVDGGTPSDIKKYELLADLFGVAQASTDAAKALVVAAWLQEREGHTEISTQTVNRELNHLGHKVGNITRAFDSLRDSKPNLVMQLKKDGTSKQARKTFKVTVAGLREVERLLRGEP
jgi:hypothetical protein